MPTPIAYKLNGHKCRAFAYSEGSIRPMIINLLNNGAPCTLVQYGGKLYECRLVGDKKYSRKEVKTHELASMLKG